MELVQLVADRIAEAARPLRDEVASLKLLLARVGDSLEATGACASGGQGLAPVQASFPLDCTEQKSSVVEEEHLFGCFSPRGSPCQSPQPDVSAASPSDGIDDIIDPVLLITPELHESCGESSVVLPLVLGSSEALVVATTPSPPQLEPCESLDSLDSGEVLAPNSDALFAKELCGLLASLEAASPGYGKDIACVLAGKASEDLLREVEKSLRKVSIWGRRRKRGVARKASTDV
jgi:hypothetical protein